MKLFSASKTAIDKYNLFILFPFLFVKLRNYLNVDVCRKGKKKEGEKQTFEEKKKPFWIVRIFFPKDLLFSIINLIFAAMFEKEIEEYERIRQEYQQKIVERMKNELTQKHKNSLPTMFF